MTDVDITEKERAELLELLKRAGWLQTKLSTALHSTGDYFIYRAHDAIWPLSRYRAQSPRPDPGADLRAAAAFIDKLAEAAGIEYEPKRSAWGEFSLRGSAYPWLQFGPDAEPKKRKRKKRKAKGGG